MVESREQWKVAVDLVVLTVQEGIFSVLLIERGVEPFRGWLALPGGFVRTDEDLSEAAIRELKEETGLGDIEVHLEQQATYGSPGRDPRGRILAVAYLALVPGLPAPTSGTDAAAAAWKPLAAALAQDKGLAFDHSRVLADGVERARAKLEYSPLASAFCRPEFTIAELRGVYEAVWGVDLDPRNFHRKATTAEGFVTPTGRMTQRLGGRPAQLYRAGPATTLWPPVVRPKLASDPKRLTGKTAELSLGRSPRAGAG